MRGSPPSPRTLFAEHVAAIVAQDGGEAMRLFDDDDALDDDALDGLDPLAYYIAEMAAICMHAMG